MKYILNGAHLLSLDTITTDPSPFLVMETISIGTPTLSGQGPRDPLTLHGHGNDYYWHTHPNWARIQLLLTTEITHLDLYLSHFIKNQ